MSSNNGENVSTEKVNSVYLNSNQKSYSSPEEYFTALEKWIHYAYIWQNMTANFPYISMCNQYITQISTNNNVSPNPYGLSFPSGPNVINQHQINSTISQTNRVEGIECRIPSLWKRLFAEFLDFLILFFIKLSFVFVAIDLFEIIDLNQFDFDALHKDMKLDYKVAIQMTHNIMILEMFHRVVVCFFETFWLVGGMARRNGGSTPGKSLMGLRVVRCETVTPLSDNEDTVLIQPGTDLTLGWAFARSFIKNLVQAFFIPGNFAFLYFRYNRASYDMICNTIVIEEPIVPHRPHRN
uniref:RDD domain-containing protein n=1 Tax=Clastoptera arizonana TaxID=38151 RepID=A0A1B6E3Q9_9HEMI